MLIGLPVYDNDKNVKTHFLNDVTHVMHLAEIVCSWSVWCDRDSVGNDSTGNGIFRQEGSGSGTLLTFLVL